jgi:hypothetical protein
VHDQRRCAQGQPEPLVLKEREIGRPAKDPAKAQAHRDHRFAEERAGDPTCDVDVQVDRLRHASSAPPLWRLPLPEAMPESTLTAHGGSMFDSTCSQRMTATSTPYGSAGHEPVPTSRQAIGDPAVPPVTQHL